LLPAGTVVTPPVLGLAAAAGYDELTVTTRPRVEILVLGDELLDRGAPREGRLRDALSPMLPSWLGALGAEVLAVRRLVDDAEALRQAVLASVADVVITTGGTAAGPKDHVHPVLAAIGARLLVDGVAVRPGHPMLLAELPDGAGRRDGSRESRREGHRAGRRAGPPEDRQDRRTDGPTQGRMDGTTHGPPDGPPDGPTDGRREDERARDPSGGHRRHLIGLPGNPLAAVSGVLTLAAPLLRTLAGIPEPAPYLAPLTADVSGHPVDTRLVPVVFDSESAARPLRFAGPAMLRGLAMADGMAVIPPGGARAGTETAVLDLGSGGGTAGAAGRESGG
jgi:molybdopterin molybdotransferase